MKGYHKNILSFFKDQKGFTLLELIYTMTITSVILVSVLTVYQINYSLLFNSSEISNKLGKVNYIERVLNNNIGFSSLLEVSTEGDVLTVSEEQEDGTIVEKLKITFDSIGNKFAIVSNGETRDMVGVAKAEGKIFELDINSNDLTVNFLIQDRHGEVPFNKFYKNKSELYNQTYYTKEIQEIDDLLKQHIGIGSVVTLSNGGDRMEVGNLIMKFEVDKMLAIVNGTENYSFENLSRYTQLAEDGSSVNMPVFELDTYGNLRVRLEANLIDFVDKFDKWYFVTN